MSPTKSSPPRPGSVEVVTPEDARAFLVAHTGLACDEHPEGPAGARSLLRKLRCIQLDPIDCIGTNAELVGAARVGGMGRGGIYQALLPGHAFEHFAKERCLLPAALFPWYRQRAVETPWWRLAQRLRRLPEGLIEEVYAEVLERGPLTARELSARGRVKRIDWSGWKGTGRAEKMALDVLWTRCRVVVCGRTPVGGHKVYDVPERALPEVASREPTEDFLRHNLRERVEAAGLMAWAVGPWWGMLRPARDGGVADELLEAGELVRVQVLGARREYLAPGDWRERPLPENDDRMRILGPLDPLLWNRPLVERIFGFRYLWEVYKPAEKREWGYYVCPLLHQGRLVGRVEARRGATPTGRPRMDVIKLWKQEGEDFDEGAWRAAKRRWVRELGA